MFMVFVFLGNITFNINALQQENTNLIFWINGTVRVISSEPPCKNSNVRFANVPLILCLIKCVLDIFCFCFFKLFLFIIFLRKWLAYFLLIRIIVMENIQNETLYEYITIFFLSNHGFKGTVGNRVLPSLHGGSLEIKLTAPLMKTDLTYLLRDLKMLNAFLQE